MTPHQRDLLRFIQSYIAYHDGVAPTFTEMMQHMAVTSKSGIHRILKALEERGYISRIPHRQRAIEVLTCEDGSCPTCGRPR